MWLFRGVCCNFHCLPPVSNTCLPRKMPAVTPVDNATPYSRSHRPLTSRGDVDTVHVLALCFLLVSLVLLDPQEASDCSNLLCTAMRRGTGPRCPRRQCDIATYVCVSSNRSPQRKPSFARLLCLHRVSTASGLLMMAFF